ncbi:MAG: 2'-5' RNA ligase family protein [Actinobacteria bacterium]|nr:2'-5' RNA ligase family protein [Actinomycetota bacterium]
MMLTESALLIEVPEAEPVIGRWRTLLDPAALVGVPAHVTVLYPFLAPNRLDEVTLRSLGDLFRNIRPFPFALTEVRRWPDVVYLVPEPREPFADLTEMLVQHWPDAKPYEGKFDRIIPHVTVAHTSNDAVARRIVADVSPYLPLDSVARTVTLMVTDNVSWTAHTAFSLGT